MKGRSVFLIVTVLLVAFFSLSVLSGCATRANTYERTISKETNKFLRDMLRQGGKEIRKGIYD